MAKAHSSLRERRTYQCWSDMKSRCYHAGHPAYARYGGRGIRVCRKWRVSFWCFLSDMGLKPNGLTLDRIDNDGDYEPANCRWATYRQQASNTCRNHLITHQGRTQTVAGWAGDLGMARSTLSNRLRAGWSVEAALSTPPGPAHNKRPPIRKKPTPKRPPDPEWKAVLRERANRRARGEQL